jgi:hypothetical protein
VRLRVGGVIRCATGQTRTTDAPSIVVVTVDRSPLIGHGSAKNLLSPHCAEKEKSVRVSTSALCRFCCESRLLAMDR